MKQQDTVEKSASTYWAAILVSIIWIVSIVGAGLLLLWEFLQIALVGSVQGSFDYAAVMARRQMNFTLILIFAVTVTALALAVEIILSKRPAFLRNRDGRVAQPRVVLLVLGAGIIVILVTAIALYILK